MITLKIQNIRTRLTLWNILMFGGILVLYALVTSWFFLHTLNRQLDESLIEDLELIDQMLSQSAGEEYQIDTHGDNINRLERFLELWSSDGRLLFLSKSLENRPLGGVPDSSEYHKNIRSQVLSDGTRMRVATKLHTASGQSIVIRLSVREKEYFSDIYDFVIVLSAGILFGLLLVTSGAYFMARRALNPIDMMAFAARRISSENLQKRIPVRNPTDEIGRLAEAFNELLERVERAFIQLRRCSADASHELRTPLTAMRSVGEVGLQIGRTAEEYREVIGSMLEESNRLTKIVDSLIILSHADSGLFQLHKEQLDLLTFVKETVNLIEILAEEKKQELRVDGQAGTSVFADRSVLNHALLNLIDNAIKFTPEGGIITLKIEKDNDGKAHVDVIDSGPGIPSDEQGRIFERFYRLNKNYTTGSGLGLAIALWAAEAHGGCIKVDNNADSGCTFHLILPQAPA